jgi:hypothetical protein
MGIMARMARLMGHRDGDLTVENTGAVTEADGGKAVTGYSGPPPRRGQRITVKNTGDATASGSGSRSVSGIDWT